MRKEESELPVRIRKRWECYAAAFAGAACISPLAHASIVYQPEQYTAPVGSHLTLPIGNFYSDSGFDCLAPNSGQCFGWSRDNIVGGGDFTEQRGARGYQMFDGVGKGSIIGASRQFGNGFFVFSQSGPILNTHTFWRSDSFLGFEIPLGGGQYNFGWAQVSLQTSRQTPYSSRNFGWAIHINGYAYETTPNVPISAGQTTETDPPVPEPGSLGLLALGFLGLQVLRRKHASSS